MVTTFNLEFDSQKASHRRAADWLAAQADPTEAIAVLVTHAGEGAERLAQWEELVLLLAKETRELRSKLGGAPLEAKPEVDESPESAQRLDSMFG